MTAAPAEISRPRRRMGTADFGDSVLAILVLLTFVAGLVMLVRGVLTTASLLDDSEEQALNPWLAALALTVLGLAIVLGPLLWVARSPRTRSAVGDFMFMSMKAIMFVAGLVCFAGGMFSLVGVDSYPEEVGMGLLAILFILAPIVFHVMGR